MRYAIFADVHGNIEALQAVLKALAREDIDAYYCCGDIVGYGADPKKCLKVIREINATCVAGNHDWAVARRIGLDRFHEQAKSAVEWTQKQLNEQEKTFLACLPLFHRESSFVLVHGTFYHPEDFQYLTDQEQAKMSFSRMDCQACFIGHSHAAQIFVQKFDGCVDIGHKDSIDILPDHKYIVNVGSVGQPRDGNPKASYCILDLTQKMIEMKRVSYDLKKAQDKILKAGLPSKLASRLALGR